jgi:serine/threonine protein kinase
VGNEDQPDKKPPRAPTLPRLSNEAAGDVTLRGVPPPILPPGSGTPSRPPRVPTGNQARVGDPSVSGTHATQLPEGPPRTTRDRMGQAAAAVDPGLPPLGEEKTAIAEHPPEVGSGDPYIGKTVADRYRVLSKLGEGGMGVVYLAEHVFIEKKVAVKILSEDFARKADLVARFMQEAKAASKIGHENIIDITDFGETASGSVFFVMEFLEGADLAHHIREGAMPIERARYVMNQVCRALGAAHGKGIIHRDLKPENIYLIERNGRPDFVKILDFGIAKMSSLDSEGGARLTRTGMIFGTPEYMSPEQAKGDRPDHRVDIYAAGCILYEMLTGDVPFHAETFMGVLTKHMFEQPEPPSVRAPHAGVTPGLEAVVLKALAKDRDQRYQTMKEMAVALEEAAGGSAQGAWGNESSGVMLVPRKTQDVKSDPAVRLPPGGSQPTTTPPKDKSTAALSQTQRKGKSSGLIAGFLAFLVVGVGGAIALVKLKTPPPPLPKPVVAAPVVPPVVVPPKPVEPSKPALPARHELTIKSDPTDADVFSGVERLGSTPLTLHWDESSARVGLVLKKKGYKDAALPVTADKNHEYVVPLARVHSSGPARPPVVKTTPTTAPPPVEAKPEPKPAGKLRDLKDPFAN